MTPARIAIAAVVLAIVAGLGYYFLRPWFEPPSLPAPPPNAAPAAPTGPRFPIATQEKPLPRLAESDPALREAIFGLLDAPIVEKFLQLEDVVRRVVATVDNLPRETVAWRLNPFRPIGGLFVTSGKDEHRVIAAANSLRYAAFVRMVEGVDTSKAVAAYVHFYPLFQQAYLELGYPNGYFNDRLVEVIDHLLATPDVKGPLKLVAPHVLYEYADPEIEERSIGQKVLIRVGPENAARLKAKLTEIRAAVTAPSLLKP